MGNSLELLQIIKIVIFRQINRTKKLALGIFIKSL